MKALIDASADAQRAYEISKTLSKKGNPINMIDILLSAQALEIGASIVTSDRDFVKVREAFGLEVIFTR
jgi:predicted nucleic acid-binding protein